MAPRHLSSSVRVKSFPLASRVHNMKFWNLRTYINLGSSFLYTVKEDKEKGHLNTIKNCTVCIKAKISIIFREFFSFFLVKSRSLSKDEYLSVRQNIQKPKLQWKLLQWSSIDFPKRFGWRFCRKKKYFISLTGPKW